MEKNKMKNISICKSTCIYLPSIVLLTTELYFEKCNVSNLIAYFAICNLYFCLQLCSITIVCIWHTSYRFWRLSSKTGFQQFCNVTQPHLLIWWIHYAWKHPKCSVYSWKRSANKLWTFFVTQVSKDSDILESS